MALPVDLLTSREGNAYEFTCASIKRAAQITLTGDEDIEKNEGKIISAAIGQILEERVRYRYDE
jgi:DNA-directed RNA polymerase subunit omega